MKRILLVEDDEMLNKGIAFNLEEDGVKVLSAFSIREGLRIFEENKVDLVVLDVNLPDGNGFEICKKIREENNTPIMFLSACDMEFDVVKAFKLGADDYVTKPFSLSILRERIFALLRRYESAKVKENIVVENELTINYDKIQVFKNGELLNLTPTEFRLLKAFATNKGKVLTRSILLEELWDKDCDFVDEHALTVNINRLRSKIEGRDSKIRYIKTVYGMGYMWCPEE